MNIHTKLSASKLLTYNGIQTKQQWKNIVWFSKVPKAPPDKVFGVVSEFVKDKSKDKVNLAIGVYRDDESKPYILNVVRMAENKIIAKKMNKEYPGMLGNLNFCKLAFSFLLGPVASKLLEEDRVAMVQSIAGSGALGLAAMFLVRFYPKRKTIYLSDPTWDNHINIFETAGFEVKSYRYYDQKNMELDCAGLIEDLQKLPNESVVLFHAHAHNPTGFDPSPNMWDVLADLCKEKKFYVVFDSAYQGFASGNPKKDAYAVQKFARCGINMAICQSFSKNMGLYGERIGCLSIITDFPEETDAVISQLKVIIRALYSNPPLQGARIAELLLGDKELNCQWLCEVRKMADRMIDARHKLKEGIIKAGSKKKWDHITNQIGMFSYIGLDKEQVAKLRKDFHIYLLESSRISIAGITSKNVEYVANAFHEVSK